MRKSILLIIATALSQLPGASVPVRETRGDNNVRPLLDRLGVDSKKALGPVQVSLKDINSGIVNYNGITYEINLNRELVEVYDGILRRLGLIKPSVNPLLRIKMLVNPDGKNCSSDILNGVARAVQPEPPFPSLRYLEEKRFMSPELVGNVNAHFVKQHLTAVVIAMIHGYDVPSKLGQGSIYVGDKKNKISLQDGQLDLRSLTLKGLMESGPDIFATPQYPFKLVHWGLLGNEYFPEINKIVMEYLNSKDYKEDKCAILGAISGDKDLYNAFKENYLLLEKVVKEAGNNPERLDTKKLFDESLYCNLPIKLKAECVGEDLYLSGQATAMMKTTKPEDCARLSVNVSSTKFASRSR